MARRPAWGTHSWAWETWPSFGLSIKPAERGWCHTHATVVIGKDLSDTPGRIKSLFSSLCLAWLEPCMWWGGGLKIEGKDSALQLVQVCQQCLLIVHTNPLSKPLAIDRISFPAKAHRPFQRHFNLKALLFFFFLAVLANKPKASSTHTSQASAYRWVTPSLKDWHLYSPASPLASTQSYCVRPYNETWDTGSILFTCTSEGAVTEDVQAFLSK